MKVGGGVVTVYVCVLIDKSVVKCTCVTLFLLSRRGSDCSDEDEGIKERERERERES